MRNPEAILNNLSKHSNEESYRFERLYRILFNEEMYHIAYQSIYAKPGNMTPGADGQTIDQMSIQRIESLMASLKDESYKPTPVRRVYIPKKNGKKRPLGIPSFEDKLVQKVVTMILEAIYEGYFEYTSHGFRPYRSCHTALTQIQKEFTGTKWFIEGDIKGFFDNIDHEVLISILRERINDERFLRLIRKFLKAGYMERYHFYNTYSGTPQGGIISPMLANIYLDKFDKYVKKYADNFNIGSKRRITKEYYHLSNLVHRMKRKISECEDESKVSELMKEYKNLRTQMLQTPCAMAMDNEYRRMRYVRYADDFLIGVSGSKADCEKMKADITEYMREQLKLELSAEKTLITNARDKAKFLGYEIFIRQSDVTARTKGGFLRRCINARVALNAPMEVAKKKLLEYNAMEIKNIDGKSKGRWWPTAREALIGQKPERILAKYNSEIRGFYEYYSIANNIGFVGNCFGYVMKYSFYKTLGRKYRCSIGTIKDKYRRGKDFVIPYRTENGKEKACTLYNAGFARKEPNTHADIDILPDFTYELPIPTLIDRLTAGKCELCGKKGKLVMHHVRKLTLIKGDTEWDKLMLKIHRKTLAVCEECNNKIQNYVRKS